MNGDFKSIYDSLRAEQNVLNEKMQTAKLDAIKEVQDLINVFGISRSDLTFEDQVAAKRPFRPRGPAAVKYRTPTGVEWTGKGNMKKEFSDYLYSVGLTEADKDKFLVPELAK